MLITQKKHANKLLTFLKETSVPFPAKASKSPWWGNLWAKHWAAGHRKAGDVWEEVSLVGGGWVSGARALCISGRMWC